MKTQLLFFACIFTMTVFGGNTIPNGGFENWNSRTYEFPEYYPYTSNSDNNDFNSATFNVSKTTIAQSGAFAVKLVTVPRTDKNSLQFGYFINARTSDGNPSDWKGGIPCNEKPTGIRGYYKYNQALGDTALVIVTFSKAGNNIGTYFFPLEGVHTNYTEFNFTFTPALAVTPDSMILGFASSYAITEVGLSGSELYIDNVSLTGVTAQPAQLNGNFESWGSQAIESIQDWNVQSGNNESFKKTTDAKSGSYAIELQTYLGDQNGVPRAQPSMISTGYLNNNMGNWAGGIPYTYTIDTLAFSYKFSPSDPTGKANLWMQFKKNGQNIAYRGITLDAKSQYQYTEIPIDLTYMGTPDSVIIGIQSNSWSDTLVSHVGSVLKIDDLHFKATTYTTPPVLDTELQNGGFENWNSSTYEYPEFYPYNSNTDDIYDKSSTTKLFKTTEASHGQYAVRLLTNETSQNEGFGYFLNSNANGDPSSWKGGIPINERPTGIKGYYKYNVAAGDTALIIATFRKNGSNIGSYFIPLGGIHTSYAEFDYTFSPALTQTPDTMILGFASSWAIAEIGLPGSELFIDNVSLKGVISQPAQMNGDFESWSNSTIETPMKWNPDNDNPDACKKTTDAAAGNFALELHTFLGEKDGRQQAEPSEITNGYWDENSKNWEGGIKYDSSKNILSFYYKYAPAQPSDCAQVWIMLKKNGQTYGFKPINLTATGTYKHIQTPIETYNSMYLPDQIIIGAQSNLWSDTLASHVGSVLIIDEIELKEGGSGPSTPVNPEIVPNGNFELWDSYTYEYPEFYPFNSNSNNPDKSSLNNLFKTGDAQHGLSAVRLVTNPVNENDVNFGYIINSKPNADNPESWVGGIPCNEKPTGIMGYYKYNQATADSAMVIVTFSKTGSNIATYAYSLKGVHTTYTPFDFTFSPALSVTPDSMIVAFASSLSSNQQGVPGSELYIDNISLKGVTTQPAKLNGDFESWISTTIDTPTSWYTEDNDNGKACKKTNMAAEGNFAVELHTYLGENDGKPQARPGRISTGYYNNHLDTWSGGSPFTNAIDTLGFYYKYAPALPNDSAEVSVQFGMGGESFWYNNIYLGASATFQYAEIPIMIYHPFYRADTVIITAQSNLWSDTLTAHVGSVLIIDNIHFKSKDVPASIALAKKDTEARLFPNPTNGIFRINLPDGTIEKLEIYNMAGQKIISLSKNQIQTDTEIDMTTYPRGIYLIRIQDGNKTEVKKLILR